MIIKASFFVYAPLIAPRMIIKAPFGILSALITARLVIAAALCVNPALITAASVIVLACRRTLFRRRSPDISALGAKINHNPSQEHHDCRCHCKNLSDQHEFLLLPHPSLFASLPAAPTLECKVNVWESNRLLQKERRPPECRQALPILPRLRVRQKQIRRRQA